MAQVGTPDSGASPVVWTGGAGANNNDIVIQTLDSNRFDTFLLKSQQGVMDVFVDLGDGNFIGPMSIADLGATSSDPVIVTVAARLYGFRGSFKAIQVQQNGATAVTGAILRMQRHD